MYGKQKEQIDEGIRINVGRSLHCNRKSLRAYIRRKAREGYVFHSIARMRVAGPPTYWIELTKK